LERLNPLLAIPMRRFLDALAPSEARR